MSADIKPKVNEVKEAADLKSAAALKQQEDMKMFIADDLSMSNVLGPQNTEAQENPLEEDTDEGDVLQHVARIMVPQEPNKSFIYSYHYEYKDYLDSYGYIDVR